jgi:ribosomal protein S18 acetylase RimI-like enzyme
LIRTATAGDAEALSAFARQTFPLGCPADVDPADIVAFAAVELTATRFHDLLSDARTTTFLADSQGKIVGYTMFIRDERHAFIKEERVVELRKFYVDPAFHGQGLAHALMQAALGRFGSETVWLSVFSRNPRAISFYQRYGFEVVGEQKFLVGKDPQNDFVMRRDATAAYA